MEAKREKSKKRQGQKFHRTPVNKESYEGKRWVFNYRQKTDKEANFFQLSDSEFQTVTVRTKKEKE